MEIGLLPRVNMGLFTIVEDIDKRHTAFTGRDKPLHPKIGVWKPLFSKPTGKKSPELKSLEKVLENRMDKTN